MENIKNAEALSADTNKLRSRAENRKVELPDVLFLPILQDFEMEIGHHAHY